jgi:hypothetical protein
VAEAVAPQPVAPASPAASLLTSAPQHDSRLAAEVPGDAIFYAEVQDAGVALQNLLTVLRSNPETQASIQQIDSALNALGGTSQLVGWVHDAGFVFGTEGSTIEGALLLEGADAADAQSHERQLEGLLHLAGPSTGLTIGETTVEGTRVVTIDLPPTGSTGKLTIPNQIAIAVHERVLLIALGQESIRRLVTLQASGSLAQAGAFRHAASRSFPIHGGTAYFNVSALASLAESLSTPDELATYQQNVKPYIAPLEAFLATFQNDGSLGRARLVMTVVTPTQ